MLVRYLFLTAALLAVSELRAEPPVHLDLLVTNAKVCTGEKEQPEAAVIGVRDGRIAFVRTASEWDKLLKDGLEVIAKSSIDAKGRRIVPGFHDSHLHMLG